MNESLPQLATPEGRNALRETYRRGLLEDTVRFWFPRAVNTEHGGFLHCFDRDGSVSSTLKGNLWKNFFHHPRMQWACWKLLDPPW